MSAAALAARLAELVGAVTAVAAELKQLERRNVLLEKSIATGERHHTELRLQMAELRDQKIIDYTNEFLDAFERTLAARHLDDLAETFRAFRARTKEDESAETVELLRQLNDGGGQ